MSNILASLQQRKQQLQDELKSIEKQIWDLEASYIEETNHYGNVVKGWEGYLNSKPLRKQNHVRKMKITLKDRIFSNSSLSSAELAEAEEAQEEEGIGDRISTRERRTSNRHDKQYAYAEDLSEDEDEGVAMEEDDE